MRLLVIEDDPRQAAYLERAFREAGRVIDLAPDLRTGLVMLADEVYDAVLLARGMDRATRGEPADGLGGLRDLRAAGFTLPTLVIGAKADPADKAACLRAGADDALSAPVAFVELAARLDGLVARHRARAPGQLLRLGALSLDVARREAWLNDRRLALSPREFLLLHRLAWHAGEVVTRAALLEAGWPFEADPPEHVIDRHVAGLRRKLGMETSHEVIEVVRGVGYRLRPR